MPTENRVTREQADALEAGRMVILDLEQVAHVVQYLPWSKQVQVSRLTQTEYEVVLVEWTARI